MGFKSIALAATTLILSTNLMAAPIGPTWPAPGGTSFASSGISPSHSGGVVWTYSGFDSSGGSWSSLYWGNQVAGLALDGIIDDDGSNIENLLFTSITGNTAYAYGNSNIIGNANYNTRYSFTITDLSSGAINFLNSDLGTGANLLADVSSAITGTGGFNVRMEAQIQSGSTWVSARNIFDPNSGQGQGGDLLTSINNGLYYEVPQVPVPAAAWLFGSGLLGLIGVARRKKS